MYISFLFNLQCSWQFVFYMVLTDCCVLVERVRGLHGNFGRTINVSLLNIRNIIDHQKTDKFVVAETLNKPMHSFSKNCGI